MTISYPRTFPTHKGVRGIHIRQRKVVGVSTAPSSLIAQTYEWPGERWEADFTLPPMSRADGEAWIAWLISLRGPVGSFLMGDPAGATARGSAAGTPGTPQVNGAQSARARTLDIKTGLGTVSNYLRAGDWISLGTGSSRRLHKVLADASLSSGNVTLDIWPSLRANVSNNDTVYVANATGRFMLAGNPTEYDIDVASLYRPNTIACIEDLRS